MIEFLSTVTNQGQTSESGFAKMVVLDAHKPVVAPEDLKDGEEPKYDSGYFLQHNKFTVQLSLQDLPQDKEWPLIGKVYKVTIEEVGREN